MEHIQPANNNSSLSTWAFRGAVTGFALGGMVSTVKACALGALAMAITPSFGSAAASSLATKVFFATLISGTVGFTAAGAGIAALAYLVTKAARNSIA
jgi:hypothetical protein